MKIYRLKDIHRIKRSVVIDKVIVNGDRVKIKTLGGMIREGRNWSNDHLSMYEEILNPKKIKEAKLEFLL